MQCFYLVVLLKPYFKIPYASCEFYRAINDDDDELTDVPICFSISILRKLMLVEPLLITLESLVGNLKSIGRNNIGQSISRPHQE